MTKYCKGCGVLLQNEDENALGYVPTLDASYCQRCYRIRHYWRCDNQYAAGN